MLSLTTAARTFISNYASPPYMPWASGLRIAQKDGQRQDQRERHRLMVSLTVEPEEDDIVVERDGARVFCEPVAAERLAGAELDVRKDREGRAEFVLRNQRCL